MKQMPITRIAVILATAAAIFLPIALICYQSLLDAPFFQPEKMIGLGAYRFIFEDPDFRKSFLNSLYIACGMGVISVPLGSILAFLMVRTDLPGRKWLEPLLLIPIFFSPMVLSFGYVVAAGPVGFCSIWAQKLLGAVPWNVYSMGSIIAISGLTHVPHVYLYSSSALRSLGSDVEEAARVAGAGPLRVAMNVSMPMVLRIKGDFTNFDQAGGNDASGKSNLSKDNQGRTFAYAEQRARLLYTGKLTGDVKGVSQFEIDSRWGDTSQAVNRNQGGAIEADQVNLETKNVYMEFKVPYLPTMVKAGLMPFDDAYKGIFLNADIAGAMSTTRLNGTTLTAGWLRGYDNKNFKGSTSTIPAVPGNNGKEDGNGAGMPGRYSLDLAILDVKHALSKDLAVGGSYYMTYDNLSGGYNVLNTFGLNAAANLGPASVDGFVLFQTGDNPTNNFGRPGQGLTAFAANLAGKVKAGPGTARASLLYASGDNGKGHVKAFQGVNQLGAGSTTSTYSAAKMTMLITNTKYAANTDRALINTVSNNDMGVIGGFLGYDVSIDKAFGSLNLGMAAAARENRTFKPVNLKTGDFNGNYVGTEINAELGYKITENLTASLVGGYVVLGDYYKDTARLPDNTITTPDNPWKTQLVLNLIF